MTGDQSLGTTKRSVLGVRVDAVDYDLVVESIVKAAHEQRPMSVSALAVHGVMTGVADARHRARLNEFDLLLPDGQPVRWAMNLLHHAGLKDRVRGTTMMVRVLRAAARESLPVYLYGSTDATLALLRDRLPIVAPGLCIVGATPSRFRPVSSLEEEEIFSEIHASGARITFVGLGCPRQERFVYAMHGRLGMPTISVGAAFNYLAGSLRPPPSLVQRTGLEWAWRLGQDPKHLWRRYLLLNPAYLGLVVMQATGLWDPGGDGDIDPRVTEVDG
jgi:N-acetylglucosaminyldiphosphoundecaprenol N-acetyl-beta-D-mannosaminyltransferase